jgi:hypothetical protein
VSRPHSALGTLSARLSRATGGVDPGGILKASVTPLASIFGSGFLIIVPVLERTLGAAAVFGAIAVSVLAWLAGTAIRHNVSAIEPRVEAGTLPGDVERLDRFSDLVIVVAYVISVALYLRIMAEYVGSYALDDNVTAERAVASSAMLLIVGVGVTRGFGGLDLMDRVAVGTVLILTTVLGGALFVTDAVDVLGAGIELPPIPDRGLGEILLVLGGIVITVQGFETIRYLGEEFDAPTRIWASRFAQLIAASIYIGFVLVATPLMGLGTEAGPDDDLLDITGRVAPLLALPLVLSAILSQFSAATADTVAAAGNLHSLYRVWMRRRRPYLLSGIAAILMIWLIPTFTIIAIASRAFAAYYCIQCVVALMTSRGVLRRSFYGLLAVILAAITLLAQPVG